MQRHAWVVVLVSENGNFNFVSDRPKDILLGTPEAVDHQSTES